MFLIRTIRWLDRCIAANSESGESSTAAPPADSRSASGDASADASVSPAAPRQALFAIVQGGLDLELRRACVEAMLDARRAEQLGGFAIGGLAGGEDKREFARVIGACTERLPRARPRYAMGVGYALDLVLCVALGCDMFDCVFPTRTAVCSSVLLSRTFSLL